MNGKLYKGLKELKKGESGTMFMQMNMGTAAVDENKYRLGTCVGSGAIIIYSEKTGRNFTMGFRDVLERAIEAGIDTTDPIHKMFQPEPRKKIKKKVTR